jgi:hypothetical protein
MCIRPIPRQVRTMSDISGNVDHSIQHSLRAADRNLWLSPSIRKKSPEVTQAISSITCYKQLDTCSCSCRLHTTYIYVLPVPYLHSSNHL